MEDFALQSLPSIPVPPPPLSFSFFVLEKKKKGHLYQSSDGGEDMCKAFRLDSSLRGRQVTYRAKINSILLSNNTNTTRCRLTKKVPVRRNYSLPFFFFLSISETKENEVAESE